MINSNTKREKKLRRQKNAKRNSIIMLIFVVIAVTFLLLLNFIIDLLWFKEVGYVSVFFTKLVTQLKYGVPMFLLLSILMGFYLRALRVGYFKKIVSHEDTDLKKLRIYTAVLSILFGGIVSVHFISNLWFQMLEFINSTDFNIKDPLFGLDVSFYIFRLEFLSELNAMLIGIVLLFVIATLIYYLILLTMHSPDVFEENEAQPIEDGKYDGEAAQEPKKQNPFGSNTPLGKIFEQFTAGATEQVKPEKRISKTNINQLISIASGKLTLLGIIFYLMLAAHFALKQFDLLHDHTGVVYGAGFTSVNIILWLYRILAVLSVAGAVTIGIHIKKRKLKKAFVVPGLIIAVGIVGTGIGMLVQNFIVSPDEINKESEYLARNIEFTQYAYDIADVDKRPFQASEGLTAADIANNNDTVSNIRINDYLPVKTFYNQTQSIRQYYKFNDVDVDRYMIDGKTTQSYLSVREIDDEKINDTWINRHLKYTHGYGLALSRVDKITASGQPDVIVRNIPPESLAKEIKIDTPQVYFGELSDDYVIVNTGEDEFDYPNGQENAYSRYEGTAGIKLNPLNRLMFAIKEGSMKLLVSSNVKSDSRIIINRDVTTRVSKIMPYLSYEDDPYGVTVDGKIYWVIDAYTTSSYYPYSEPYSGKQGTTNYFRNSVKAVVDAYNGTVTYYIVDDKDPIAATYRKIFPSLFKTMADMPEGLKSHLRYPNALFAIQADVYGKYHMNDVKVFYQNEDIWEVSHEIYGTKETKISPNYFVLKLPGESGAEFVSMLPYSPKSKNNMTAILLTRNDGEHYGELVLYTLPKNRTVYGPMQIEAQIDQNTEISQDFSLWSQAGSTYSRGNMFVVPIEDSLLYVEPIYLEAANSAIPEVKRVVVAYGDKISYKPTLAEALENLFGDGTGVEEPESPETTEPGGETPAGDTASYIKQAQELFDKAQESLKAGDWAGYGRYMQELSDILKKLNAKN